MGISLLSLPKDSEEAQRMEARPFSRGAWSAGFGLGLRAGLFGVQGRGGGRCMHARQGCQAYMYLTRGGLSPDTHACTAGLSGMRLNEGGMDLVDVRVSFC